MKFVKNLFSFIFFFIASISTIVKINFLRLKYVSRKLYTIASLVTKVHATILLSILEMFVYDKSTVAIMQLPKLWAWRLRMLRIIKEWCISRSRMRKGSKIIPYSYPQNPLILEF